MSDFQVIRRVSHPAAVRIEKDFAELILGGDVTGEERDILATVMENSNRRTLILWSAGGMLVSSIALVICLLGFFSKISSLFWVIAYVSFFEIGLGPM